MGLLRLIAVEATVAPKFLTDRGLMRAHDQCNFELILTDVQQGLKLIRLFVGQLSVVLMAAPLNLVDEKRARYYRSSPAEPSD